MFAKNVMVVFDPPLPDLSLGEAVGKVTPSCDNAVAVA